MSLRRPGFHTAKADGGRRGGSFHSTLLGFTAHRQWSDSGGTAAVPLHRVQLMLPPHPHPPVTDECVEAVTACTVLGPDLLSKTTPTTKPESHESQLRDGSMED